MLEGQFENQEDMRNEEAQTEAETKEEIDAYNEVMKSIRQYALGKGGPSYENDAFNFDRVTSEISGFRNKMELEQQEKLTQLGLVHDDEDMSTYNR